MQRVWVRRFVYWLICLAVAVFVPMGLSWWAHSHRLINQDGVIGGAVGVLVGAAAMAYWDARGR